MAYTGRGGIVLEDNVNKAMQIIETSFFTRQILKLISEDERQRLMDALIQNPSIGDIIQGSGGCRKVRWGAHGRGKSGGIRVIYFWRQDVILFLLVAFPKNVKADLSAAELKQLKGVVKQELGDE
jgi:mRNA-degrading endonuclease RelE of RelBE toxin-antitoxin system